MFSAQCEKAAAMPSGNRMGVKTAPKIKPMTRPAINLPTSIPSAFSESWLLVLDFRHAITTHAALICGCRGRANLTQGPQDANSATPMAKRESGLQRAEVSENTELIR